MQEKAARPPEEVIKQEIHHVLEQLDVLQKQSLNRFDNPEIYKRVFQLLDVLDAKIHELNHFHKDPDTETNRIFQDLFFHSKKMQETVESLKLDVQKLEFQQQFIASIDHMKESLNQL